MPGKAFVRDPSKDTSCVVSLPPRRGGATTADFTVAGAREAQVRGVVRESPAHLTEREPARAVLSRVVMRTSLLLVATALFTACAAPEEPPVETSAQALS